MKLREKILLGSLSLFGILYGREVTYDRLNRQVQSYVAANLDNIMKAQEKEMGIKYSAVPEVFYLVPSLFTEKSEIPSSQRALGFYYNNSIFLYPNRLTTPENNLTTILGKVFFPFRDDVKHSLDHELGHYHQDKHYPIKKWDSEPGLKLITEGIAEYFKRRMNKFGDNFKDSDWPKKIETFKDAIDSPKTRHLIFYNGGYHLVKPIIDKFGLKGMEHLTANIPTDSDLINLPGYQQRALKKISQPIEMSKDRQIIKIHKKKIKRKHRK